MSIPRQGTVLAAALVVLLSLNACQPKTSPTPPPAAGTSEANAPGGGRGLLAEATPGVRLRLADAAPGGAASAPAIPTAVTSPLSAAEAAGLLARLPELPESAAERVSFSLRPGPKPPALPGNTIQAAWPPPAVPPDAKPPVASGPLEVLRFGPEGDVALAPNLSVTFNQPMVPLTSVSQLAAEDVPVRLNPSVPGSWRWLGTRTAVFEPSAGRLPMATAFTVEVPAGTKSASGATLATAKTWTFRTPPPSLTNFLPGNESQSVALAPVLYAEFDQAVAAEAILAKLSVKAGGQAVALRPATDAELAADEMVDAARKGARDGRWVAFKPQGPLPTGTTVEVVFDKGLPSAEGPRVSEDATTYRFSTYGPLVVTRLECNGAPRTVETSGIQGLLGASIDSCDPQYASFQIGFSNALDLKAFRAADVKVDPPLIGQRVAANDLYVVVSGRAVGRTTYSVELPASLRDAFGQTLGSPAKATFKTGDANAMLAGPSDLMVVLDPAARGQLRLWSVNHPALDVKLYRVVPTDWPAFTDYRSNLGFKGQDSRGGPPPGELAWQGKVEPVGDRDALANVTIDLAPALKDGLGQVVAVVEPPGWSPDDNNYQNRPLAFWVQATQLAVDALARRDGAVVWVNRLADGRPVGGAKVTIQSLPSGSVPGAPSITRTESASATTDATGVANVVGLPQRIASGLDSGMAVAELDGDLAFEPGGLWFGGSEPGLIGHLFTDRGIYQPGEEVHFKGWGRRREGTDTFRFASMDPYRDTPLNYSLRSANDNTEVVSGTAKFSALFGFDAAFTLPKEASLGEYRLDVLLDESTRVPGLAPLASASLRVAEFRRPEFEVKAAAREPSVYLGDANTVEATASYYSGGGLGSSDINWQVNAQPTQYSPPGHEDYVFGEWRPWFYFGDMVRSGVPSRGFAADIRPGDGEGAQAGHSGRTDAAGRHGLDITVEGVNPLSAVAVNAQATVQDVNRQAWSGSASYLVHPSSHYVGLKPDRWFAKAGEAFNIAAIVAEIDGQLDEGVDISIQFEKLDWEFVNGEYAETATDSGSCKLKARGTGREPETCKWTPPGSGRFRVTADVVDPRGRPNRTRLELWVAGGEQPPSLTVEPGRVTLVPSKAEYRPGETAEVLIQAPFAPAEGLVSLVRDGLVRSERITLQDGSFTYKLPITADDIPNARLQVDVVGADYYPGHEQDPRGSALPMRPAYATGEVSLKVSMRERTLKVIASPAVTETMPGGEVQVDVVVADAGGRFETGAEVALVVVDEAVLALTGYRLPDPLATFYPERGGGVPTVHSRSHLQLAEPEVAGAVGLGGVGGGRAAGAAADGAVDMLTEAMPMAERSMSLGLAQTANGADKDGEASGPPVRERSDLNPLAGFYPALATDSQGRASVTIKLPDSVTRYRVMAVAVLGPDRFGTGEAALTARLPLTVRPSAPRFLNYGDGFELPVVIQNQGSGDVDTDVVVRAVNLALNGPAGLRVRVPAHDRVEVRFPAVAAQAGSAVFQVGAFAGAAADAQRVTLPVYTPATTEAFATYGEIDQAGVVQPLLRPADAAPEFGGLELSTTSTAVGGLADAYLFLHDYPYECAEQVASRLLATVALADVLAAFNVPDLPTMEDVKAAIRRDVEKLLTFDTGEGFGWWPGMRTDPFVTVHAGHALALAGAQNGFNDDRRRQLAQVLANIDRLLDNAEIKDGEARRLVKAHALAVRRLLTPDAERTALVYNDGVAIANEAGERDTETLGWLLTALAGESAPSAVTRARAEIQRQLSNRVAEEAGKAVFRTSVREEDRFLLLSSDNRSTAVAELGLMAAAPESDLVPKVARGLLAGRTKGHWMTTQENAYVLLALGDYFKRYERETPDFVARAWLGEGYLGESSFRGRTADRVELKVPMAELPAGQAPLTLTKDGSGRLYYRLGLKYAPKSLALEPLERGFSVARRYEGVDDPKDVTQTADGTWQVRAGSRVRVRLVMVAESLRHHVALIDPLPAGFEAIDPDLEVSQAPPAPPPGPPVPLGEGPMDRGVASSAGIAPKLGGVFSVPGWEWWWSHQALRTERAEAFAVQLSAGVYQYNYIARATTPGTFVVPPPRAEEMYAPETFGRGASNRVVVK